MEKVSLIKVNSLYLKKCVQFVWENRQLHLGQPNSRETTELLLTDRKSFHSTSANNEGATLQVSYHDDAFMNVFVVRLG